MYYYSVLISQKINTHTHTRTVPQTTKKTCKMVYIASFILYLIYYRSYRKIKQKETMIFHEINFTNKLIRIVFLPFVLRFPFFFSALWGQKSFRKIKLKLMYGMESM